MKLGILLFAAAAMAQTLSLQFDAATIKPAPPQEFGHISTRTDWDNRRLNFSNVNLKEMMARAWHLQEYQISGPDFLETERFDVVATIPEGKASQMPLMLQALLQDRFKLSVHRETKDLPIFDLIVAKGGPKLKSADAEYGVNKNGIRTRVRVTAKATTGRFAEFLSGEVSRPVVDKTGLTGAYDMTLDYSPAETAVTDDAASGPSLFTALQEQLGLKLESAKGPVETIVVDHIERSPTEN